MFKQKFVTQIVFQRKSRFILTNKITINMGNRLCRITGVAILTKVVRHQISKGYSHNHSRTGKMRTVSAKNWRVTAVLCRLLISATASFTNTGTMMLITGAMLLAADWLLISGA